MFVRCVPTQTASYLGLGPRFEVPIGCEDSRSDARGIGSNEATGAQVPRLRIGKLQTPIVGATCHSVGDSKAVHHGAVRLSPLVAVPSVRWATNYTAHVFAQIICAFPSLGGTDFAANLGR
jgi:hypothetical protein